MIVGLEQLAFFASYLRHLLALLDIRAEVVSSPRHDSITRLSRVDEDSLVIAFSAGRAHPIVVRAMKLAKHRRATTMAITDATLSEVGEHSDHTLYYSSNCRRSRGRTLRCSPSCRRLPTGSTTATPRRSRTASAPSS